MEPTFVSVSVGIDTFALEPNAAQRTLAKVNDQDTAPSFWSKKTKTERGRRTAADKQTTTRGGGPEVPEEVRFLCVCVVAHLLEEREGDLDVPTGRETPTSHLLAACSLVSSSAFLQPLVDA